MRQTYLNYYKQYFQRPEAREKLTKAGNAWKHRKVELLVVDNEAKNRFIIGYEKARRLRKTEQTVTARLDGYWRKYVIEECLECKRWFFRREQASKGHPLPKFCSKGCSMRAYRARKEDNNVQ